MKREFVQQNFPLNFTKGLPHDPETGILEKQEDYLQFVKAIMSGSRRDFRETPLGHPKTKGDVQDHAVCNSQSVTDTPDKYSEKRNKGIARLKQRLVDAGVNPTSEQVTKLEKEIGLRAWESQSAGLAFDLEGPDAQAVTMPPAPGALQ